MSKQLDTAGKHTLDTYLLHLYWFGYGWIAYDVGIDDIFIKHVTQRLNDSSTQRWNKNIWNTFKVLTYKHFKSPQTPEL